MAWDTEAKKLAIRATLSVESNLKYDAINYRDPITVGVAQWYGTRAAGILNRIRNENSASWNGVASSLVNDLANHPQGNTWWTGRYLTNAEGESLRPVLRANNVIQNKQCIDDFDGYGQTARNNGMDIESNTDSFIFFCSMYHQNPRNALAVMRAVGPNANVDAFLSGALNNTVFRNYASRYRKVRENIRTRDTSGIDLGLDAGAIAPDDVDPDIGGGDPAIGGDTGDGGTRPETDLSMIKQVGSQLHIHKADGSVITAWPRQGGWWSIGGDESLGAPVVEVPPATDPDPTPSPPGGTPGDKALAWMRANSGKWKYSQGAGRNDPFTSGYTDCSACLRLAYRLTSNIDPGSYTTPQSSFGTLITTDRAKILRGEGLLPGDLIFYRAYVRSGWPYNHVEMYAGNLQTIGQAGSKAPGPSVSPISTYVNWGKLAVMVRRPW